MYNDTFDGVLDYVKDAIYPQSLLNKSNKEEEADLELLNRFNSCLNDIMSKYDLWSTNTNDAENLADTCNDVNRQEIE